MPEPLSVKSSVPGLRWPATPDDEAARMLAVLAVVTAAERLSPAERRALALDQLRTLLLHARETVPFYRSRLLAARIPLTEDLDPAALSSIDLLPRSVLREAELRSTPLPVGHGTFRAQRLPGGGDIVTTGPGRRMHQLATLREHLWHGRDLTASLAIIRPHPEAPAPDGRRLPSWGPEVAAFETGACDLLDARAPLAAQVHWLAERRPSYLFLESQHAPRLCEALVSAAARCPDLRQVRASGVPLSPQQASRWRRVARAGCVSLYTVVPFGPVALACERGELHVVDERLLVEIVDDRGDACDPGGRGRVVLTDLHNFATPLIRLLTEDEAAFGPPCPCGRTSPVLCGVRRRGAGG